MQRDNSTSLGIRAKLNVSVGIVMLVSALAFGSLFALIERASVLAEKQDHLAHVASMAKLSLELRDPESLSTGITEFNAHLSQATGATHHMWIESEAGGVLYGNDGASSPGSRTRPTADNPSLNIWSTFFPPAMWHHAPIQIGLSDTSAVLWVEESLAALPGDLAALLMKHIGFAAALFALIALSISLLAHFVIVRPIGELVAATEQLGKDGDWETFAPSARRKDEIGILCERFADLSRRLAATVRDERYGSAHLVAVGVERSLEEPLRHAEMELAVLRASLSGDGEELQHCENLSAQLAEIADVAHRLKRIGAHPIKGEVA